MKKQPTTFQKIMPLFARKFFLIIGFLIAGFLFSNGYEVAGFMALGFQMILVTTGLWIAAKFESMKSARILLFIFAGSTAFASLCFWIAAISKLVSSR